MGLGSIKCQSICGLVLGIVLLILACVWIPSLNALLTSGAKDAAQLTEANEENWKGIPGHYDINIHHNNHFFHCLNVDDVVYKGEKPLFEQYGPYIYRETDTFDDVQYGQSLEITGLSDETYNKNIDEQTYADGLFATFNTFTKYYTEWEDKMDTTKQGVDTPLKLVNQAAMGVWYAQMTTAKWRFMVVLLFNVVNDLGR